MDGFETGFARSSGARLRFYTRGNGPTVVLLPGLGRAPDDVEPLASAIAAEGFRTILPEVRGIGESIGPLENISLRDLAADMAAVIAAAGGAPVVMIGHAFGNRISRAVAAYHPTLVRAVVLLGASGKVAGSPEVQAATLRGKDPGVPREERARALAFASFGPGRDVTPWLDGWNHDVAKAYLDAAAASPMSEWWTAGTAPMLVVQGLADVSAPPANGRMLVEEIGPRARLVELEGVGHAIPVEAPDEVAAMVLPYLKALGSEVGS